MSFQHESFWFLLGLYTALPYPDPMLTPYARQPCPMRWSAPSRFRHHCLIVSLACISAASTALRRSCPSCASTSSTPAAWSPGSARRAWTRAAHFASTASLPGDSCAARHSGASAEAKDFSCGLYSCAQQQLADDQMPLVSRFDCNRHGLSCHHIALRLMVEALYSVISAELAGFFLPNIS